jgi:hypothetical protein
MKTCSGCHYFEPHPSNGASRVGNCLAEPPVPFLGQAPPSVLQRPGAPQQPATFGVERITRADRKACRHWEEAHGRQ